MAVKLFLQNAQSSLREVTLRRTRTVVGRKKGCKVRIRSSQVSRMHCVIVRQGKTLVVRDLRSTNGTFVNGAEVNMSELKAGDVLGVGALLFLVQIDGVPPVSNEQSEIVGDEAFLSGDGDVAFVTGGEAEPADAVLADDDDDGPDLDDIEQFIVPSADGAKLDIAGLAASQHPPPTDDTRNFLLDDDDENPQQSIFHVADDEPPPPKRKKRRR